MKSDFFSHPFSKTKRYSGRKASLSFLGLGIQPPLADWGGMVRENAGAITFGIYTPLLPAAAIAVLTIAVNLIVDWFLQKTAGLRDEY